MSEYVHPTNPRLGPPGVPEPIAALNKVKIIENGDPLVDLRTFCPLVQIEEPDEILPYLRHHVAEMLNEAAAQIPAPYHITVVSALRSLTRQTEIWQMIYDRKKKDHPTWAESALRRATNQYVAPVDQPAPPGHCTGGAVDVVLQKPDGSFIDLVPPDIEDWDAGHTWTYSIDPETRAIRMLLVTAMLNAGFSNCRDEYWHYSWGDSGWAVRAGETTCPYGAIEPPVSY